MPHNGSDVTGVSVDLHWKSEKSCSKFKGEYRAVNIYIYIYAMDRHSSLAPVSKKKNILLDLKGKVEILYTLALDGSLG